MAFDEIELILGPMRTLTIVFTSCVLGFGCGGSSPNSHSGGPNDDAADPAPSPTNGEEPAGEPPPVDPAAIDVVLNEAAAIGPNEWLELANKGEAEVEIGGYFIADSDKTTGQAKKKDAMRFPPGTKMKPNERIVILTSKKSGTVGPHPKASCLPDGPDTCFFASFGVSATTGESIHLLAPDGDVVWSTAIPKSASADAGGSVSETQCRLPDMTGDFQTCAPTPGEPNRGL